MVKPNNTFLIDARFIIQRAHHEFLGATLLSNQGKDHTFAFAFARDFLRLRQLIGVRKGVVVIGRDAHALATDQNIEDVVHFLSDFTIPCVHNALDDTHNIIGSMCAGFTHLVTAELALLQLVTDRLMVGLAQRATRTQHRWITLENIRKEMGVSPEEVPTYITLTRGVGAAALTSRQAARLIELYGDLNSILDNLATISPRQMRRKLETSASDAKSYYARCRIARTPEAWRHDMGTLQVKLGTRRHLALLSTYGFWSLKPLLRTPAVVHVEPSAIRAEVQSYRAVVDRAGLKRLEAEVKNAKMCAIDSESDDTDPRRATLFGVSFAVKAGEAHFVPLLDDDLKGVSRIEVIKALRRICASSVHFIGHNVKYDYVLLRRHGIRLRAIHFDTMLAAYECYGDWTFFNLPYLCQKLLGKSVKSYAEVVRKGRTFLDVLLKEMVNHACQDADMALRLYPILVDELKGKRIATQYWNRAIPLAQRLGDLEFEGFSVNVRRIEKMRNVRLERAERVKNDLCRQARRAFDPDSQIELAAVLRDVAGVRSRIGASATRMSVLEQLAASEPTVRLIVQYKRLRKEITALESIVDATTGKKVYPLFSQIRYPCGIVATAKPSLFDVGTSRELRSCFGRRVHALIRDADRSVDVLAKATGDPVLGRARAREPKGDQLLWSHELLKGLDYNALLLSCAIGYEDSVLSRMFLIDHLTISRIRHDVRRTYPIVFRWIQGYQRRAEFSGYAARDCRRKYIAGLRSSSIAKRKRAREEVVRWLVQF